MSLVKIEFENLSEICRYRFSCIDYTDNSAHVDCYFTKEKLHCNEINCPYCKKKDKKTDRLENLISEIAYLQDCLKALRNVWELNDCNKCTNKRTCKYVPKVGQMVRYNCPHFEGDKYD